MAPNREKLAVDAARSINLESQLLTKVDAGFECAAQRATEAFRATEPETDIGECFETALRAVLTAAAAQPDLTRLCLVEAPGLGASALERKDAGMQRFVDLLDGELARRQGQAPPLVSEMIVGGIYEVIQRTARAGDIGGLPDLADQLRQLWLPALRGN